MMISKACFWSCLDRDQLCYFWIKDIKNLGKWAKPKRFSIATQFPPQIISIRILWKVLIIAPWNYPFQLALCPLVSAVAGNQVVIKPSELTGNTSAIISKIITKRFIQITWKLFRWCWCVPEPTGTTLGLYIFYRKCCCWKNSCTSGSKTSYPVTLELGGKPLYYWWNC
jgi:aldehyde dehydrogenase (NAD+)